MRTCPKCHNLFEYNNCCGCFVCPHCEYYYNCADGNALFAKTLGNITKNLKIPESRSWCKICKTYIGATAGYEGDFYEGTCVKCEKQMKPNPRYYYSLIVDNSVQWFSYLIKHTNCEQYKDKIEVIESYELPNIDDECPFLSDIWSRPTSFSNTRFDIKGQQTQTYNGVYVSEREFGRIRRLIELYPLVVEFRKLGKL